MTTIKSIVTRLWLLRTWDCFFGTCRRARIIEEKETIKIYLVVFHKGCMDYHTCEVSSKQELEFSQGSWFIKETIQSPIVRGTERIWVDGFDVPTLRKPYLPSKLGEHAV